MTAAINPLNTVRGPANIWVAALGTTEPAQTNAALIQDPGAGWSFMGATQGGCTWEDDQTVTGTRVDQAIDEIGGNVTARKIMVTFSVAEATLANLYLALNRFGSLTVGTGINVYTPGQPSGGSIPGYSAILVDGFAPQLTGGGGARRRAIFRKLLNTSGKVGMDNDPTKNGLVAFAMQGYMVSPTIDPYVTMDQTA